MKVRMFVLLISTLALFGCAVVTIEDIPIPEHINIVSEHQHFSAPPAGKALVNFHLVSTICYPFRLCIFNKTDDLICDLPALARFQYVCEPGDQTFISWLGGNPVSVVKGNLVAGKVYDIMVYDHLALVPLRKDDKRRVRLVEIERGERTVTMTRTPHIVEWESTQRKKLEQVKQDFFGGSKASRVVIINEDDCR